MRTLRALTLFALVALGLPLLLASPAAAATITVDTTVDGSPGAATSLREAISQADANAGTDTISLANGATYTLNICDGGPDENGNVGGDLNYISPDSLTIQGHGSTIEQICPDERVLQLSSPGAGLFSLYDLTITGGEEDFGSGLYVQGDLRLEGVRVTDNRDPAADGEGEGVLHYNNAETLDIVDSDFSSNEGLGLRTYSDDVSLESSRFIANGNAGVQAHGASGTVYVDSSVFRNNGGTSGSVAGGLTVTDQTLTVRGSTFVNNQGLNAGAIRSSDHTVTIEDSTISGNTAEFGAAIFTYDDDANGDNDDLVLEHVTLYGNLDGTTPGNIDIEGDLTAFASIVGQANAGDSCDVDESTSSQGYNLDAGSDCGFGAGSGDAENIALKLGALTAGNDPQELVRLPGFLSPAVDNIPIGGCTGSIIDQAARNRPSDGDFSVTDECDSGAVERPLLAVFADVPDGANFFDEIGWMAWRQITTGYPGNLYKPAANVSRQAMSAFMYRLEGSPPFSPGAPSFADVPASNPFFKEIEWMNDEGITEGFPGGLYRPTAPVTRQAMSAFMYRLEGEPPFVAPGTPSFPDVPLDNPFFTEIEWMNDEGITTGYPDLTFRPADDVSRQAMSAFMFRLAALS